MPSKKSGGKRAVEKKHQQQAAARGPGYKKRWKEQYEALGDPPDNPDDAHEWVARVGLKSLHETMLDMAMPPEARREQVGRLVAQVVKALDPAKKAARLADLERAVMTDNGTQDLRGETSSPRAEADLS